MKKLVLTCFLAACAGSMGARAQALSFAESSFRTPDLTLGNAVAYDRANAGPLPDALPFPSALTTTDQQNATGGTTAGAAAPQGVGQSFTPTQATMNAVTLPLFVTSGSTSATVQLQVFAGGGFGGTLLATGTPVTFTNTAAQTIELYPGGHADPDSGQSVHLPGERDRRRLHLQRLHDRCLRRGQPLQLGNGSRADRQRPGLRGRV